MGPNQTTARLGSVFPKLEPGVVSLDAFSEVIVIRNVRGHGIGPQPITQKENPFDRLAPALSSLR